MKRKSEDQDDLLYQLAIALLELIDKPVDIGLERADSPHGLVLNGTLLRAFDTPTKTTPSLSVMIGSTTTTIRITTIERIAIQRMQTTKPQLRNVHLLLSDGHIINIKPQLHKPNQQTQL